MILSNILKNKQKKTILQKLRAHMPEADYISRI